MLSQGSGTDTGYSDWQSIWFTASVKMEAEVAHNESPEELSKTWLSRLHPRPIRTLCRRTPDGQQKPAQPWLERNSSTENYWASQGALVVKNPPANAGDTRDVGSIPRLGRSLGGGHGNPLQYSCLENPTDRKAWQATVHGVTKSQTRLKRLSTHTRAGR